MKERERPFQIADLDAVGVALADREPVDADYRRPGRPRTLQVRAHVLLVERLYRAPVAGANSRARSLIVSLRQRRPT